MSRDLWERMWRKCNATAMDSVSPVRPQLYFHFRKEKAHRLISKLISSTSVNCLRLLCASIVDYRVSLIIMILKYRYKIGSIQSLN